MMCFTFKNIFYYVPILVYTIAAVPTPGDDWSLVLQKKTWMKNSFPALLQMTWHSTCFFQKRVYYIKYGVPTLRTSTDGRKIGCP